MESYKFLLMRIPHLQLSKMSIIVGIDGEIIDHEKHSPYRF